MALEAHHPGPDREAAELEKWEADAFLMITEGNTYADARFQLSYALRVIRCAPPAVVIDAFQRNARKIWRATPPPPAPGSSA